MSFTRLFCHAHGVPMGYTKLDTYDCPEDDCVRITAEVLNTLAQDLIGYPHPSLDGITYWEATPLELHRDGRLERYGVGPAPSFAPSDPLPMLRWLDHIVASPADSRFAIIATTAKDARDEVVRAMQDALPGPVLVLCRGGTSVMVFGRPVLLVGEDDVHKLRGLSLSGLYVHGDLPGQFVEAALTRVVASDAVFRGEVVDV